MKNYSSFNQDNKIFKGNSTPTAQVMLPPGAYTLNVDPRGELYFQQFEFKHDVLIDLPTKEYQLIVDQIETFLKPETKATFEQYGYLYKFSALLHGKWGTGKTCIISRVANFAKTKGAVILFNPDPRLLPSALDMLDEIQPNTTIVVVFEELDKLIPSHEGRLLNLLDGEVQKNNIIYLATTNFLDKIPARVMRPGRFAKVIEVFFPDAKCREHYLSVKLGQDVSIPEWVEKTEGFSIDELKATVLEVKCLGATLDEVIARMGKTKAVAVVPVEQVEEIDWEVKESIDIFINELHKRTGVK